MLTENAKQAYNAIQGQNFWSFYTAILPYYNISSKIQSVF